MIASLRGNLIGREPPTAIIEAGGVGYEVWLPISSFAALPALGAKIIVHTVEIIRPESRLLCGFQKASERAMFKALIRIAGIGAKGALALLSTLDPEALANAIEAGDAKSLARAPGIGRRTAERILIEMRGSAALAAAPATVPLVSKAVEALTALGFPAGRARAVLISIDPVDKDVSELVKAALKELAGG